jgi:hypothetical protein
MGLKPEWLCGTFARRGRPKELLARNPGRGSLRFPPHPRAPVAGSAKGNHGIAAARQVPGDLPPDAAPGHTLCIPLVTCQESEKWVPILPWRMSPSGQQLPRLDAEGLRQLPQLVVRQGQPPRRRLLDLLRGAPERSVTLPSGVSLSFEENGKRGSFLRSFSAWDVNSASPFDGEGAGAGGGPQAQRPRRVRFQGASACTSTG